MNDYTITFLDEAKQDLKGIIYYIKHTLSSPRAAEAFKKKVKDKFDTIKKSPYLFSLLEGHKNTKYHKALIKNYVALYYIDEQLKTVYVTAIVYGGRNYKDMI